MSDSRFDETNIVSISALFGSSPRACRCHSRARRHDSCLTSLPVMISAQHAASIAKRSSSRQSVQIAPAEVERLFESHPAARALSIDCFDTLVWRYVASPVDVFYRLAQMPAFRAHGITAAVRATAEEEARRLRRFRSRESEVALDEIYRAACPEGLSAAALERLAAEELSVEKELCFAFPGAIGLLRAAARRGIPVTVVSDTYFSAAQLAQLLASVLPDDAFAAIDRVVCSSDHRVSKSQGLLEIAFPDPAGRTSILHLGDNRVADFDAANDAGLSAVHLLREETAEGGWCQMGATALSLLDPGVRSRQPAYSPYQAPVALSPSAGEPDSVRAPVNAVGSMLHAFARWIRSEYQALAAKNHRTRLLFLLRDGWLPWRVCKAIDPAVDASVVRISRFTAYAASFRSLEDIERYLIRFVEEERYEAMLRQLLVPRKMARAILARTGSAVSPIDAFCQEIRQASVVSRIISESEKFRRQMFRYLEREAAIVKGDTVVFVDLGYTGTAHQLLEKIFAEEQGIELLARYFLMRGPGGYRRRGFIDTSWCDPGVIRALVPYVAFLETVCTEPAATVEGYTDAGEAVLAPGLSQMENDRQRDLVLRIQDDCVAFAAAAENMFSSFRNPPSLEWLRSAALAEFGRMIYFPARGDIESGSDFQLDINLGTKDHLQLFDLEQGLDELRRRGVNIFEQHAGMRLHYPSELRAAGLELSMALLTQHRFNLQLPLKDWNLRSEPIEIVLIRGEETARDRLSAVATHDGFFSCVIPLGDCSASYGLLLGQSFSWLQMHSVDMMPLDELHGLRESIHRRDIRSEIVFDGIRTHDSGLLECLDQAALLMIPGAAVAAEKSMVCRFVYRPISRRL